MNIFIIISSTGEYDDFRETPLFAVSTEAQAKHWVKKLASEALIKAARELVESRMNWEFHNKYVKDNPAPVFEGPYKIDFDQTKHKDKEYVKAHIERKTSLNLKIQEFHSNNGPYGKWAAMVSDAVNNYMLQNFDPEKVVIEEDMNLDPPRFSYQEIEYKG